MQTPLSLVVLVTSAPTVEHGILELLFISPEKAPYLSNLNLLETKMSTGLLVPAGLN